MFPARHATTLLAAGLVAALTVPMAQAQSSPVTITLTNTAQNNQPCRFNAPDGLDIGSSGAVDATGTFVSGDPGCPAGGGGGAPPAFTMTSTPASSAASPITVPATVAVGWSGATNATGCYINTSGTVPADVASAWYPGKLLCSGAACATSSTSLDLGAGDTGGPYTFAATCTGPGGSVNSSVQVFTSGGGGGGSCPGVGLPAGVTSRQTTGSVAIPPAPPASRDFTQWSGIWGYGAPDGWTGFPNVLNQKPVLYVNNSQFVATQFTVPTNYSGQVCSGGYCWGMLSLVNTYTTNQMDATFTISPTCGDFAASDFTGDPDCMEALNIKGSFVWDTYPASQPQPFSCKLTPGATYYLNIVGHGDGTGGASCPNGNVSCMQIKTGGNFPPPSG